MTPPEAGDAWPTGPSLAEFWTRGGEAAIAVQTAFMRDMTGWFGVPSAPSTPASATALDVALRSYERSWSTALDVAATTLANLFDRQPGLAEMAPSLGAILDPHGWFPEGYRVRGGAPDPAIALSQGAERVVRSFREYRRRSLDHEVMLVEAWMRSAGTFARTLLDPVDVPAEALGELWRETADRTLTELRRTPAFVASVEAFTNAAADLQAARSALGEILAETHGLPSRAEVEALQDQVADLQREVGALQAARAAG